MEDPEAKAMGVEYFCASDARCVCCVWNGKQCVCVCVCVCVRACVRACMQVCVEWQTAVFVITQVVVFSLCVTLQLSFLLLPPPSLLPPSSSAIIEHTNRVIYLEDNDVASVGSDGCEWMGWKG